MNRTPIFPGSMDAAGRPATLGVMGGGQLGRMFVHAAQRLGYFTAILDPDPLCPAGRVSHHHVCSAYDDAHGLAELASAPSNAGSDISLPISSSAPVVPSM